jgi:hypothetical protein
VDDREFAQDRKEEPSITQILQLMNGTILNDKIASSENRIAKWLASGMPDAEITDQLFLTTVSRRPNPKEKAAVLERIAAAPRAQVYQDALWVLLNSKEFIYNH